MKNLSEYKKDALKIAGIIIDELFEISSDCYRNPELSGVEFETSKKFQSLLKKSGFKVSEGSAGMPTAFTGTFGAGKPNIAIMAEMDALPEIGHACGHNISGTASIGAGIVLSKLLKENQAKITILGTPAEETGTGKIEMVKYGIFKDIDAAMMAHSSSKRQVLKMFLGLKKVFFTFHGKASHAAAYPEDGINAVDAVILTFNAIGLLRQQLKEGIKIHGIIKEGGTVPNIIPERASAFFYVRAYDKKDLNETVKKVISCAKGAAEASRCKLTVDIDKNVMQPFKINYTLANLYSQQLKYLGLKEHLGPIDKNNGSSDVGNVSWVVPTIHPHLPITGGKRIPIHSVEFAKATVSKHGKEGLLEGVKALSLTVLELIFKPQLLKNIKKEFKSAKKA